MGMRLLDVESKQLLDRQIVDSSSTQYAILSHRWQDSELTFQDLGRPDHVHMPGYAKISSACTLARRNGDRRIWIDTCCIDRSSSAELSEAINSMYRWYEDARVCYVYLPDVEAGVESSDLIAQFTGSEWFTRGWTLQELLAPRLVEFYNRDWEFIGTRTSLKQAVSEASSIPAPFLSGERSVGSACIAQRMAWAASRQTTRPEDMAYSLLGIFDVNMPLLYGEGDKAFQRLQQELLKQSSDQSLFAWGRRHLAVHEDVKGNIPELDSSIEDYSYNEGLLASAPALFQGWAGRSLAAAFGPQSKIEMQQGSSGVRMMVPTLPGATPNIRIVLLDCRVIDDGSSAALGFRMVREHNTARWCRAKPSPEGNGDLDDPVFTIPWTTTKYAKFEQMDSLTVSMRHHHLQFSTPNTGGRCGSVILQTAPDLPEQLAAVYPPEAYRDTDRVLLPRFDEMGRWEETILEFRGKDKDQGFTVMVKPRSFSQAFWAFGFCSAPFTCEVSHPGAGAQGYRSVSISHEIAIDHQDRYVMNITSSAKPLTGLLRITRYIDTLIAQRATSFLVFSSAFYFSARSQAKGPVSWSFTLRFLLLSFFPYALIEMSKSPFWARRCLLEMKQLLHTLVRIAQHAPYLAPCWPGFQLEVALGVSDGLLLPPLHPYAWRCHPITVSCLAVLALVFFKVRLALESVCVPGSAPRRKLAWQMAFPDWLAFHVLRVPYFYLLEKLFPGYSRPRQVQAVALVFVFVWTWLPVWDARRAVRGQKSKESQNV